eukprot:TRINITY_DN17021_c0_g1_i1.p1 TRINITY_DN17021_c0_g1~~TRINITY_DN17021_c0_g1_i1.p1  ORF type:complete len:484 (+),score=103.23 TRINITY_DN17021_c0_g1_i1:69-1454(+)
MEGPLLHIQVSDELAKIGGNPQAWGDSLVLSGGPCRRKIAKEEDRANGIAWASCGMRGWRASMEDASLVMPFGYIGGGWRDAALFGVFDGHGGEQVARFVARQLPVALAEQPAEQPPEKALAASLVVMDDLLGQPAAARDLRELTLPGNPVNESALKCGTTAVCCLLRGSEFVVSNIGDSRAVLCRGGNAVHLTSDHKPELPEEEARIKAAGGFLEEEALPGGRGNGYRVNGDLNLSRALGDLRYKDDAGRPAHAQVISGMPDTETHVLRADEDEFVLLACDGVWECMTSQEVVNFVRRRLPPAGSKQGLCKVLDELVDACCVDHPTQRGGLGCDNITAVLIRFENPQEVAAHACGGGGERAEERSLDSVEGRLLDAMIGKTLQRLSSRRRLTPEEKAAREEEERLKKVSEARDEAERAERKRKREERHKSEKKNAKRAKFCAALDDEGTDDDLDNDEDFM